MATPQEIQKLLKELQQAYDKLGTTNPFANFDTSNLENAQASAEQLEVALEGVYERIESSKSSFKDLNETLKNIAKELNPNVFNAAKEIEGGFKKIVKEAQKLHYEEEGISKLSLKQLTSLKEKITQQQQETKISSERLLKEQGFGEENLKNIKYITRQSKLYKDLNEEGQIAFEYLKDSNSVVNTILDKTNQRISQEKILNKSLGIGGAVIDGVEKSLKKLGFGGLASQLGIEEAKIKMKETADEVTKGGTEVAGMSGKFKILKSGVGSMGKSLLTNLKDPLAISGFLINELISALQGADKQTGELAKSFGTSYSEASLLRGELNTMANLSGDININTAALQRSLVAINKEFGTSTMLNGELLNDFTQITEVAGITNETALKLSKITVATGGDLSDNTSSILGQAVAFNAVNGLALNEKEILEGVSKLSNATVLSLGMQPKELAKAVLQAKALGVELSTVEAISSSLLQFESSIENELAAELLIGRDLNLEKARTLALNGNIAGVAEEIATQIGSAEDFTNMNVIQQEALAKAVGMTRDQLAGSLIERQALAAIGEGDETALEAYNRLKEKGLSDDAIAVRLGDEKLAANLKNQSVQDRFNKSVEKLREVFVSIADPVLKIVSPIMDLLTFILPGLTIAFTVLMIPITLIADSISSLTSGFTTMEDTLISIGKLLAGIALTYGLISAIQLGITAQKLIQKGLDVTQASMGKGYLATLIAQAVAWTIMNPFKALAGIAVAGLVGGAIYSSMKDGEIDPSKGPVMTGEFGSVQLDPNDKAMYGADGKIKVGTDLFGGDVNNNINPPLPIQPFEGNNNINPPLPIQPFEGNNNINPPLPIQSFEGDNNINPPLPIQSFEGDNSINPPSNTSSPSSSSENNSLIIAEIRALRTSLESRPINVNTTVELDGEKIGSSKNVIRGLGNSSTELGTELSTNSSNLQ
jgi:hypothetical protein